MRITTALVCALALGACDAPPPGSPADAGRDELPAEIPLDPDSPWPKFRANPMQNGRANVGPTGGAAFEPWVFPTGKGIFSTPVIDGDGNIYVGSADRTFYALAPDGTERWSFTTGEIIDSSALLDDMGRVYFGSGDGHLYALDRDTGEEVWAFEADDPSVNSAYINWFEGNVAMGPGGVLYAPNDNFCTYAVNRLTGEQVWCFRTNDQTWSSPAVNPVTGSLFMGNNFLLGDNVFAIRPTNGRSTWSIQGGSTVAASPMLTSGEPDGLMIVGAFDGFVRALSQDTGEEVWRFGARDHVYASAGQLSDGTIIQPAADGTVYALDPSDGSLRWSFDTLEPIRSSPAIDNADQIYVGSGEGRLFVLNPDGTLRWAMRANGEWNTGEGETIALDARRSDLNASPALGPNGVLIAGENGGVYFVPFDYCLRASARSDARCTLGPDEDLDDDGASLLYTDRFGGPITPAPAVIEANQPLTFSLFVREGADTQLARIESASVRIGMTPDVPARVDVSGDRTFVTILPEPYWADAEGGTITIHIQGSYLVDLDRDGLRFDGGIEGGALDETYSFEVRARDEAALMLPIPERPGDEGAIFEVSRIAAPLPTILPSYNQIGFDSIHYLVGLVEGAPGHAIAWGVGAAPSGPDGTTIVDPSSDVRFALEASYEGGALTMVNEQGFTMEFSGFVLPFEFFRLSARVSPEGVADRSAALTASVVCGSVEFYGEFLQRLGFCNPESDVLLSAGAADLRPHGSGVQAAPEGIGAITFSATSGLIGATFHDSGLRADQHNFGILVLDDATGTPVRLDYVGGTEHSATPDGTIDSVALSFDPSAIHGPVRVYAMVDAYPAGRETLAAR